MSFGTISGVVGAGVGLYDAIKGGSGGGTQGMSQARQGAEMSPWSVYGPGGTNMTMGGNQPPNYGFNGFGALAGMGGGGGYGYGGGGGMPAGYGTSPSGMYGGSPTASMYGGPGGPGGGYQMTPSGPMSIPGGSPGGMPGTSYSGPNGLISGPMGRMMAGRDGGGYGPGMGAGNGSPGNSFNMNMGPYLGPTASGLGVLAGQSTGQAGMYAQGNLPTGLTSAYNNAAMWGNPVMLPQGTQGSLYGMAGGLAGMMGGMGGVAGAGMGLINGANGTYQGAYNNSLQAQMAVLNNQQGIQTAANNDNLYSTGRMGTSGGALQTQAMAQGFGLADAGAQGIAAQTGLAAQGQALGYGNALTSNAFGNFNNASAVGSNLYSDIYNQNLGINQTGYNRAGTNFANATTMAGMPAALAQQYLNLGGSALTQFGGIQNMGIQNAQLGLNASGNQANARIGAGNVMGNISNNSNYTTSGMNTANTVGNVANSLYGAYQNYGGGYSGGGYGGGYSMPSSSSMIQDVNGPDTSNLGGYSGGYNFGS